MGLFSSGKEKSVVNNSKKVIALVNQKGGVGKTTLSYNLAYALANKKKKVLAIDLDPQGNLSMLFDSQIAEGGHNVHHLLINSVRELRSLHVPTLPSDLLKEKDGVTFLPAGQELSGFELTVAAVNVPRQLILRRFLEKSGLLDHFDYVVIDAPPTLGLLLVNILCASDGILIPYRPDDFSRSGLTGLKNVLLDIEDMEIVKVPDLIAAIPNLVEMRRKVDQEELVRMDSEILQDFKGMKNLAPIANRVLIARANAARKNIFNYQSIEYEELQGHFLKIAETVISWSKNGK